MYNKEWSREKEWVRNYRGYAIMSTASWLSEARFAASYSVMEELSDGGFKVIRLKHCDGEFPTEHEAHAVGLAFGRAEIDWIRAKG
jgi:hypothetical protein